ncbi:hypothetical protein BLSS_1693 [Bifidobacterium longum subsp. suis]|uniref:Uncharacterized protein n=1 Tax=Bifidobacterium longum subsp. suis TaxID=1695 RepID=A0A087BLV8_BIFLN|nr:hypothetical protein BLSS_1693 [Bifidobacterium longum subsp. suis]
MPFFERPSGPTRHIFKYGPSRIYCYDRPDSLLMPVGARRTYRSLLKWERKLPCATPLDGIARDLGAFWLLDQWFTVGLHGWAESMISSSISDRNRTFCQSVFRASDAANPKYVPLLQEHRDMLFDRVRGGVAGLDPSAMDYVGFRAARCRAGLADWLFGRIGGYCSMMFRALARGTRTRSRLMAGASSWAGRRRFSMPHAICTVCTASLGASSCPVRYLVCRAWASAARPCSLS